MSTLVTFPALPLRAALEGLLRGIGRLDTETLRHEHGPSVDTLTPLIEAVRAAEEERAELVAARQLSARQLVVVAAARAFVAAWTGDGACLLPEHVEAHAFALVAATELLTGPAPLPAPEQSGTIFVGDGVARCPGCGAEHVGTTTGYVVDRCICGGRLSTRPRWTHATTARGRDVRHATEDGTATLCGVLVYARTTEKWTPGPKSCETCRRIASGRYGPDPRPELAE